ncbi:hypothetical protein KY330_03840 [Candidatus Woesearchaeota archaeon]|nr:hypothetical protein [Candidatus Woesearchaeota archaeon]
MSDEVDKVLEELGEKYGCDRKFLDCMYILVEKVFMCPEDKREGLLKLVDETYQRHIRNKENCKRAVDACHKFSDLCQKLSLYLIQTKKSYNYGYATST